MAVKAERAGSTWDRIRTFRTLSRHLCGSRSGTSAESLRPSSVAVVRIPILSLGVYLQLTTGKLAHGSGGRRPGQRPRRARSWAESSASGNAEVSVASMTRMVKRAKTPSSGKWIATYSTYARRSRPCSRANLAGPTSEFGATHEPCRRPDETDCALLETKAFAAEWVNWRENKAALCRWTRPGRLAND